MAKIDFEKILVEAATTLTQKMGVEVEQMPKAEVLRYFRFQEIPFLLFFLANKTHRNSIKAVGEQYELQTGQMLTYDSARHIVRKYYEEVDRVKLMDRWN